MIIIIGFIGMFLILLAFFMNEIERWSDDDLIYDLVNLIGSALMVVYAFSIKSYPFLGLNLVWALISFRDVYIDLRPKNSKRKK
jgi:amino acid transporter